MVSVVIGIASADEVKEIAVLKGPAGAVQSLSLSADGSRLVSVNSGIVWNVDEQRQLSVLKAHADAKSKAQVNDQSPSKLDLAWMSADGRKAFGLIGGSFRVWDAGTGNELFATPRIRFRDNYTAVALSPDGAYLAIAANEALPLHVSDPRPPGNVPPGVRGLGRTGPSGAIDPRPPGNVPPPQQYSGGQITVWDLTAQKAKWKIPGVTAIQTPLVKGQVDWLAFAPDGRRLAAQAEPSVFFDYSGQKLRVFPLEPNQEEPTATVSVVSPGRGEFIWLSDGKSLALRNHRQISLGDPQTGKFHEAFTLNYPRGPKDPQTGRFDETVIQTDRDLPTLIPSGWNEHQITLSADGSRLAAQLIREHVKEKVRNNCIVIWDVASRSLIGVFQLPDDTYNPQTNLIRQNPFPGIEFTPILRETGHGSDLRIALSGDGKRLAAADAAGVVRVYKVAEIAAKTKIDSLLRR
jgi:WD40 repeat protein